MQNDFIKCGYYVCDIIAKSINNSQSDTKENPKLPDNAADFAHKHNLESILFLSSGDAKLMTSANSLIAKQIKLDYMCDKLSNSFKDNSITHAVIKGSEFSKYYPKSMIRSSTDIDFYVDAKDIPKATKVLCDMGFSYTKTSGNEHQFLKAPVYNVELHTDIGGFDDKQKDILMSLIKGGNKVNDYRLSMTDTASYIFAIFHLYKHFITSGAGVRLFLDVYMISKNADVDYAYAKDILKKLDIDGFAQTVEDINKVLFENKMPSPPLKEVIEFVFESTTFGKEITYLHLVQFNHQTLHQTKMQKFSNKYGLSFMLMSKRYPILKKAPYLYPFSFVHRFFYGLFFRRDVLEKSKQTKNLLSDDITDKYKRIFDTAKIKY